MLDDDARFFSLFLFDKPCQHGFWVCSKLSPFRFMNVLRHQTVDVYKWMRLSETWLRMLYVSKNIV